MKANKKFTTILLLLCAAATHAVAQTNFSNNEDSQFRPQTNRKVNTDSLGTDKEIPKGIRVWTVDERFGDRHDAVVDTLQHMYMNTTFSWGLRGEYNTLGNLGSPRIARIFIDRTNPYGDFIFANPLDQIIPQAGQFHFTNTYSPLTNVTLNSCGDRTNGEDDFKATFAVNANSRLGGGFKFDYKYGRGYYSNQSTSHFNYTMWLSYLGDRYQAHLLFSTLHQKMAENGGINNDDYISHPEITNETFQTSEIPTVLEQNWNRHDNQHIFFSHRYNIGFNRKVPMTPEEIKARKFAMESAKDNAKADAKEEARKKAKKEGRKFDEKAYDKQQSPSYGRPDNARIAGNEPAQDKEKGKENRIAVNGKEAADSLLTADKAKQEAEDFMKNEYVPVTSIIHTLKFDNYRRIYQAYATPADYYLYSYDATSKLQGDSIFDQTKYLELRNTFALATLEGFSKWAKAGVKAFITHDLKHFELPDSAGGYDKVNQHSILVGGQLSKQQGKTLHYNALAQIGIAGRDAGTLTLEGNVDLNVPLLGDTVTVRGDAFLKRENPSYFYDAYHSKHAWWDNEFDKVIHSRLMGTLTFGKTNTTLRIAFDEIKNHAYFSQSYNIDDQYNRTGLFVTPMQCSDPISLITAQVLQDFKFGIFRWENVFTYQRSSRQDVIPVPALNVYSNLYMKFKVARVLNIDMGADVRYFTSYEAPDYSPYLGMYTVQGNGDNNVKIGNYPVVDVYANAFIGHTRFFVMMSHINCGSGNRNYFFVPHHPLNQSIFRFGVSWNFYN